MNETLRYPLLIIGYGNTMRADDGVGYLIAEQLAEQYCDHPSVHVIACRQLTPELIPEMLNADNVIFIDACAEPPAGEVRQMSISANPAEQHAITHYQSPTELLQMCQTLYHHCPQAELVTFSGKSFGFGEDLSDEIRISMRNFLDCFSPVSFLQAN